jgi:putative restriction endonuclease
MSAYDNTCCITGIAIPEILIASHIKPWKDSNPQTERTNPKNGLCLNALHDKAFDSGLISVDEEYRIIVSQRVKELYVHSVISESFAKYDGRKMLMPQRFVPEAAFLKYHLENIFLG